ncbi:unnamed protein product [Moneuplotes crassus]|uniref:Uncharacterized protein n=1 Tax=Euplotes crassus TaxID=5936 RepID=A0AAD1U9E8_EUPCR|nr:unnamed protein product [Moneuplotes crassus]
MIHLRKKKRQQIFSKKRQLLRSIPGDEKVPDYQIYLADLDTRFKNQEISPETIPDIIELIFIYIIKPEQEERFYLSLLSYLADLSEKDYTEIFSAIIDQNLLEHLTVYFRIVDNEEVINIICKIICNASVANDRRILQSVFSTEPCCLEFLFEVLHTQQNTDTIDSVIICLTNLYIDGYYAEEIINRDYIRLLDEYLNQGFKLKITKVNNISWSLAAVSSPELTTENHSLLIMMCKNLMALNNKESTIGCLQCLNRLLDGSKSFFLLIEFEMHPIIWSLFQEFEDRDLTRLLLCFYELMFNSTEFDLLEMIFTEDFQKRLEEKFEIETDYKSHGNQEIERREDPHGYYMIESAILNIFQNAASKVRGAASMLLLSPLMHVQTFEEYEDHNVVCASVELFRNVFSKLEFDDPDVINFITCKASSFKVPILCGLKSNFGSLTKILESNSSTPAITYLCLKCVREILDFAVEQIKLDYIQFFREQGGEEILERYVHDSNYNTRELSISILMEHFRYDSKIGEIEDEYEYYDREDPYENT